MATRATYYFDGLSFATAIALFTDQALTTKAADGYYSLGNISSSGTIARSEERRTTIN